METVILLTINFVLLAVLYFNISWSNGIRRKLEAEKAKNADLRNHLEEKTKETILLQARLEAREDHRIMLREAQTDRLKVQLADEQRRSAKLEKMLMQKWREAKDVQD